MESKYLWKFISFYAIIRFYLFLWTITHPFFIDTGISWSDHIKLTYFLLFPSDFCFCSIWTCNINGREWIIHFHFSASSSHPQPPPYNLSCYDRVSNQPFTLSYKTLFRTRLVQLIDKKLLCECHIQKRILKRWMNQHFERESSRTRSFFPSVNINATFI